MLMFERKMSFMTKQDIGLGNRHRIFKPQLALYFIDFNTQNFSLTTVEYE